MPANSIASMKKNPFKTVSEDRIYEELNDDTIASLFAKITENSTKGDKSLLYLDDQTASLKSSAVVRDTLKRIIYNRRHLKCNIIITAQSYVNVPLDVRKCISNLILFKPSKKEFEVVMDENLEKSKEESLVLMKLIYDKPHTFLFLNVESQRLFKNWDEVIFEETQLAIRNDVEKNTKNDLEKNTKKKLQIEDKKERIEEID
jgi:hypothetical protein